MPGFNEAQRGQERHARPTRDRLCEYAVVLRPDFRCGLTERLRAGGLALLHKVSFVFRQPVDNQFGVNCFALEYSGERLATS